MTRLWSEGRLSEAGTKVVTFPVTLGQSRNPLSESETILPAPPLGKFPLKPAFQLQSSREVGSVAPANSPLPGDGPNPPVSAFELALSIHTRRKRPLSPLLHGDRFIPWCCLIWSFSKPSVLFTSVSCCTCGFLPAFFT